MRRGHAGAARQPAPAQTHSTPSRGELFDVVGYLLPISFFHGFTVLQDYTVSALSLAHLPPSLKCLTAPRPGRRLFRCAARVSGHQHERLWPAGLFRVCLQRHQAVDAASVGHAELDGGRRCGRIVSGDSLYLWGVPSAVAAADAGVVQFRKAITSL